MLWNVPVVSQCCLHIQNVPHSCPSRVQILFQISMSYSFSKHVLFVSKYCLTAPFMSKLCHSRVPILPQCRICILVVPNWERLGHICDVDWAISQYGLNIPNVTHLANGVPVVSQYCLNVPSVSYLFAMSQMCPSCAPTMSQKCLNTVSMSHMCPRHAPTKSKSCPNTVRMSQSFPSHVSVILQ